MTQYYHFTAHNRQCASVHKNSTVLPVRLWNKHHPVRLCSIVTSAFELLCFGNAFNVLSYKASVKRPRHVDRVSTFATRSKLMHASYTCFLLRPYSLEPTPRSFFGHCLPLAFLSYTLVALLYDLVSSPAHSCTYT